LQAQASFVEAGDLLFPSGGYELSAAGKTELANDVAPRLRGLPYAKVVVYGDRPEDHFGQGVWRYASAST